MSIPTSFGDVASPSVVMEPWRAGCCAGGCDDPSLGTDGRSTDVMPKDGPRPSQKAQRRPSLPAPSGEGAEPGGDRPGLAAGDALGANVTMLTLVRGLAALVRPVPLSGTVRVYAIGAALAEGLAALLLGDGDVTRSEGLALVATYVVLVAVVWRRERRVPAVGEVAEAVDREAEESAHALALVIVGIALMTLGGRLAVGGAERVVETLDAAKRGRG